LEAVDLDRVGRDVPARRARKTRFDHQRQRPGEGVHVARPGGGDAKALAFLKLASIRLMIRKLCNPS
jgi:hypothetical protein